jgi:transcriptional regulator of aroF, aroG, tyrA and aromatic amino acid transport
MKSNLKLQLRFIDRMGIVSDVTAVLVDHDQNIVSMAVQVKGKFAVVYLETGNDPSHFDQESFFEGLKKISGWRETKTIYTLPQAKRERGYRFVLDSVSDGIISIDEDGVVTTINQIAREILSAGDAFDLVGKNIDELGLPDTDLQDCIKSKTIIRNTKNITTEKGRFQYFSCCKPIKDSKNSVVGAVAIMKSVKEIEDLAQAVSQPSQISFNDIIGKSRGIKEAISLAQKIADTDSIVSIRGESGTGKELFARAIHLDSSRSGPFVPINCAALPESLLESELFGYVEGTFTGANKRGKPGLFELAKDGTVFLDEIADMPLEVQAKILRVIQERSVRRLGSMEEIPVHARISTATNKNLEKMIENHQFREDLYYRINVLPIHIPPLRRRLDDIRLLVEHFLFRLNLRLVKNVQIITDDAVDKLERHHWPGNVRELKNVIERAAIITDNNEVDEDCILFSFEAGKSRKAIGPTTNNHLSNQSLKTMLAVYEKQILEEALKKAPSIRKTANLLNVSHVTLLNKLKKHNIHAVRK